MFNTILIRPIINLLIFLYNTLAFGDLGIAVILLVLVAKVILFPLSKKSIKSQVVMQKLQPKMKEIQNKFKDDKEEQTKAMMEFWKENKVNPVSGCLPMLIQLPILIAIFEVFRHGLPDLTNGVLYSFIKNPVTLNPNFLKFMNLSIKGSIYLALIAAGFQLLQGKITMSAGTSKTEGSKDDKKASAENITKKMIYFLPIITIYIVLQFPAVLGIYWVFFTVFSIAEHLIVVRKLESQKLESTTL
ncbi:protein translocase component YidC [bacterium]|nr:MAG: protein translocase component YidC [bacterium]